ncbi:MAG: VWA-like domain-containing protein [Acidimicrobiales bacterium]
MNQLDEQVAAARLWAADKAPYLATALFAMSLVPVTGLRTAATGPRWHLYLDPVVADLWSVAELGSVLVHEVHHLIRSHADRAAALGVGAASARRFNIAADCEINDDLGDLSLPAGGVNPSLFGFEPGQLAEAYYVLLEAVGELPPVLCGSGAHGVTDGWEHHDDNGGVDQVEAELLRQQVAVEVRASVQRGGQVPIGLERWAHAFLRPVVDWRRELRAQVRAGLNAVSGGVDYSYSRPSRRTGTPLGRDVVLPALVQPLPRIAVVVDTSASMSTTVLEHALAEIKGLLQSMGAGRAQLTVLTCDTMVRTTKTVFSASQVQLAGRGGTDMRVGVEAALAVRPRPDLVIIATDGFTPWPDRAPLASIVVALLGSGPAPPKWARLVRVPIQDGVAGS